MAKRIVAIYDRGIDKNLMQGFDVLEKYGYELTLVEKTVNEDELAYQNSMLSVEVNGPDGTPINEEVFQYLDDSRDHHHTLCTGQPRHDRGGQRT